MTDATADTQIIWAIMQTTATMRSKGLADQTIKQRLGELGVAPDTADGAIEGLEEFFQKTGGKGRLKGPPKIFISHSHHDRDQVAYLQTILEQNKVLTFLDQHAIVPGQDLKDRLLKGILWCDKLLLFWSRHAAQSKYVQWEWQLAGKLKKDLVPYALDETKRPAAIAKLVYIEPSDQEHGHAGLLRAIHGAEGTVDPLTLFPGDWIAQLDMGGVGQAEYRLELRRNGQVFGTGQIQQEGLMGGMAAELGMDNILGMRIPLKGSWSYSDREQMLELDVTATLMGNSNRDVVRIHTTGREDGWLQGQTMGGLLWRLRRV